METAVNPLKETEAKSATAAQATAEVSTTTAKPGAQEKISLQMTIGELVAKHPESIEIMLAHGLHCVGCHLNPFDTIESGCTLHGIGEKEMLQMLDEINEAISHTQAPNPENGKLVEITPVAAKKLATMMESEGKQGALLRVALSKGGCAGHSYYMEFEDATGQDDLVEKAGSISVLVARELEQKVRGTVIDYHESLNSSGFVMRNPNAKHACGCGKSISV